MKKRNTSTIIKTIVKVLFTVLLLAFILYKVKIKNVYLTLKASDPLYIFFGFLLALFFVILRIIKWHLFVSPISQNIKFTDSVKSYVFGIGLGIIIPGRFGELTRAFFYPKLHRKKIFIMNFLDKVIDLFALFLISVCTLGYFFELNILLLMLFIIFSLFFFILILSRSPDIFLLFFKKLFKKKWSYRIDETLLLPKRIVINLVLSASSFVIFSVEFFLFIKAGQTGSVHFGVLLWAPLIIIASMIQITVGGLGVREAVSIKLFKQFGISSTVAFNAAFLLFVFNVFLPALVGIIIYSIFFRKVKGKLPNLV